MTLFQLITINLQYCNMTRNALKLVNNLLLRLLYCCESGPVNAQVAFPQQKVCDRSERTEC